MKSRKGVTVASIIILIIGISAIAISATTEPAQPLSLVARNPELPETVYFADEDINLDRLDRTERLDRELTAMTFGHGNILLTIKRANKYQPLIEPILKEHNIPEDFIYLAAIESYYDYKAYSPARAAGIWQLLATTGREYGLEVTDEVDERYDPEKSTIAACKYLNKAYDKYGNWINVAYSYNAGMRRISSELESQQQASALDLHLVEETTRYLYRIIAMKQIVENPKEYGFYLDANQLHQPIKFNTIEVSTAIDWINWAKKQNITYAQLREYNPWIRSKKLTNRNLKTYKVRVPIEGEIYHSQRTHITHNPNWVI
ncbi:MAG: lytic transglycosylase domain-containing protein [Bacteroidales bacterium]